MMPQHSRMELAVMTRLLGAGVKPLLTEQTYELHDNERVVHTTPDFCLHDSAVSIYIDGPVHNKHEMRDKYIRELLRQQHGRHVIAVSYTRFSGRETERVFNEIMEALPK